MRCTVLTICIVWLTLLAGCAIQYGKYYDSDGKLCARITSGVLGTGETETVTNSECVNLVYSTRDTGISKNGADALGKVAEGVAAGVVKGVVPVP